MDFASDHVYCYDCSDEEVVSDTEYEHGMTISSSSSESDNNEDALSNQPPKRKSILQNFFSKKKQPKKPKLKAKKSHWRSTSGANSNSGESSAATAGQAWRRADTNIVSIKFDVLTQPSNMHTGDAERCAGCCAIMSHLSKLTTNNDEENLWHCEFCGNDQVCDLVAEELPHKDDVTYMMSPALSTAASGQSGTDESLVVFCVDVSGSMCVTTEVKGRIRMRGSERRERVMETLMTSDDGPQHIPGQRRNISYVSRLQGMQAAVDQQLEQMHKEYPHRRVALIAFNTEVTVYGDGTQPLVHFSGDKLSTKDGLVESAKQLKLPGAIKNSHKKLSETVFELEEGGSTALGPAMLMSVVMAMGVPGSKVIICTDGLANVGLGDLDGADKSEEKRVSASAFYTGIGEMCRSKGVSVSIISIKGSDCKMVELGKVADVTGGQVNIVDPLKLATEFGNILSDPIIATKVTATFILHSGLYIRDQKARGNKVVREIGNVTKDSEVTFEFGVKHDKKSEDVSKQEGKSTSTDDIPTAGQSTTEGATTDGPLAEGATAAASSSKRSVQTTERPAADLPFQLQVQYTDLEGAVALRVLTQCKPVTKDRAVAEKTMNMKVIGVHTAQTSAQLAQQGHYKQSRLNAYIQQRQVARHCPTSAPTPQRELYMNFYDNIQPIEQMVQRQQKMEISSAAGCYSDNEDSEEEYETAAMPADATQKKKKKKRFMSLGAVPLLRSSERGQNNLLARQRECSDETSTVIYQSKSISSKKF